MARMARVVVPGIPYHITQRGNRRQRVFLRETDYPLYIGVLHAHCAKWFTQVLAYCLMPNHVHLVVVPRQVEGLARALGDTHRDYTRHVNEREGWRGYLWQGRFASFPLDERHLLAAVRYAELNPVRAGLCLLASDWPWSSARAHLDGRDDELVEVAPLQALIPNWHAFLSEEVAPKEREIIRRHARSGRPLGTEAFIDGLEHFTGRQLRKGRAGRPVRGVAAASDDEK